MNGIRSILLISGDSKEDLLKRFSIDTDHPSVDQLVVVPETSIGIDEVRDIKSFSQLRPLNADKKTIVVLQAETLTLEAQNALLKLLEEPPDYLTTILVATSTQPFLETLLSRCAIIQSHPAKSSDEVRLTLLVHLCSLTPPARLAEIPLNTKSKEPAVEYCRSLLKEAEELLQKNQSQAELTNLKLLTECLDHLYKNANPTIALTDCILRLNLPS